MAKQCWNIGQKVTKSYLYDSYVIAATASMPRERANAKM